MALAKISGHKDINELMTCYRQTATQIAERMGFFERGRAPSRVKGDKVLDNLVSQLSRQIAGGRVDHK